MEQDPPLLSVAWERINEIWYMSVVRVFETANWLK